jgi:hypothetical protein
MKKIAIPVIIIAVLLSFFVLFAIVKRITNGVKNVAHMVSKLNRSYFTDSSAVSAIEPKDFNEIFSRKPGLRFDNSEVSKTRDTISEYNFENNFIIDIYRIRMANPQPLADLIVESYLNKHISYYAIYATLDKCPNYTLYYKSGPQDTVSKIYLNIFGTGTKTLEKNDSIAYYTSNVKNFYIKYKKDGSQDFYGSTTDSLSSLTVPIELMILKRKSKLFFVTLTTHNNANLKSGTLLSLIKKQDPVKQ